MNLLSPEYIASKIFFLSFEGDSTPNYSIWYIIVWPVIVFAFLYLVYPDKEKRWLKCMIVTGLLFWLIYTYTPYRLIIPFERIIYATSLLLVIVSGLGFHRTVLFLSRYPFIRQYKIMDWIQFGVLIFILFVSMKYTVRDQWKELTLRMNKTGVVLKPAAPANRYLTKEDSRVFSKVPSGISFLSFPWKGTVLGTADFKHRPMSTKEGTVTINSQLFTIFWRMDCHGKTRIMEQKQIDYVYSRKFDCPDFILKDKSREGLYLYEFQKPYSSKEHIL